MVLDILWTVTILFLGSMFIVHFGRLDILNGLLDWTLDHLSSWLN
jgi:hypothetical protein